MKKHLYSFCFLVVSLGLIEQIFNLVSAIFRMPPYHLVFYGLVVLRVLRWFINPLALILPLPFGLIVRYAFPVLLLCLVSRRVYLSVRARKYLVPDTLNGFAQVLAWIGVISFLVFLLLDLSALAFVQAEILASVAMMLSALTLPIAYVVAELKSFGNATNDQLP